jgi:hypothetical protein
MVQRSFLNFLKIFKEMIENWQNIDVEIALFVLCRYLFSKLVEKFASFQIKVKVTNLLPGITFNFSLFE